MADPREVFWPLKDENDEGAAAHVIQEGGDPASQDGSIGFAFKDSDGNVILPQLDAEGRLPVTMESAGTLKRAKGELAAGSLALVAITGAEITLTADKLYTNLAMLCSCRRDSLIQLIQVDDASETVLAEVILGPGQFTFQLAMPKDEITAGSTGTQKLLVKGKNFDKLASLRASLTCVEVA
jgi:hypothetical protein